jgi:hypothetical protein
MVIVVPASSDARSQTQKSQTQNAMRQGQSDASSTNHPSSLTTILHLNRQSSRLNRTRRPALHAARQRLTEGRGRNTHRPVSKTSSRAAAVNSRCRERRSLKANSAAHQHAFNLAPSGVKHEQRLGDIEPPGHTHGSRHKIAGHVRSWPTTRRLPSAQRR